MTHSGCGTPLSHAKNMDCGVNKPLLLHVSLGLPSGDFLVVNILGSIYAASAAV